MTDYESGMWTNEEIVWARDCFAQGDSVREIADVSERDFLDVALQLNVYGAVPTTRRVMVRGGGKSRWTGAMLREVLVYRRRRGETRQALAALAGVSLWTIDQTLRGLVKRGRKARQTERLAA